MTAFLILLLLISLGLNIHLLHTVVRGRPTRWRQVLPPENLDRGPNADRCYRAVRLDGHEYWFTREQVIDANERALKYTR